MRFEAWKRAALALVPLAFSLGLVSQQPSTFPGSSPALPLVHVDHGPNYAKAQQQHYVVLVSLDGFRWDYAKRDSATHLLALGKQGVWAPEGMLPSYPSLTFPNHFSIVTGLYPEHHGLVANNFLDPARQARYGMSDPTAVTDGSWYSGTPRSRDRRYSPPPGTRNSTKRRRAHRPYSRRGLTTPSPYSSFPRPTARTSSPSTTPNPTTKATSSAPTRLKLAPPCTKSMHWSASSRRLSMQPACPSTWW
jgi:hypothetical protein